MSTELSELLIEHGINLIVEVFKVGVPVGIVAGMGRLAYTILFDFATGRINRRGGGY